MTYEPPCPERVCAVFVTHHPDEGFPARVGRVLPQVGRAVVVDNGSCARSRALLEALAASDPARLEVVLNPDNRGIAAALNQGVQKAIERGLPWALTLDQDTTAYPELVSTLCSAAAGAPEPERVGVIGANFVDPETGALGVAPGGPPIDETTAVITAGALLSIRAYLEAGPFREDFFIDQVDHEHCLRLRAHGYRVLLSRRPLMEHSLGRQSRHRLLWKRPRCSNHPPGRWYYITRNTLLMAREHARREPRDVADTLAAVARLAVKALLYERQRARKLAAMGIGVGHALLGRTGRLASGLDDLLPLR